jgi:hypothetical protein
MRKVLIMTAERRETLVLLGARGQLAANYMATHRTMSPEATKRALGAVIEGYAAEEALSAFYGPLATLPTRVNIQNH